MSSRLSAHERIRRAVELHLAGATYEQIADQLGYGSRQAAHKAVTRQLARDGADHRKAGRVPDHVRQEVINSELARLDAMQMGLWARARRGDVQAIDRVLKIGERRVDLLAQLPDDTRQSDEPESYVDQWLRRLREREQNPVPPPSRNRVINLPANPDAS